MSYLKQKMSLPLVKYGALGLGSSLWLFGLVEQFYSSAAMMKYVLMSLLMAAVALLSGPPAPPVSERKRTRPGL